MNTRKTTRRKLLAETHLLRAQLEASGHESRTARAKVTAALRLENDRLEVALKSANAKIEEQHAMLTKGAGDGK
jgi:hypothetical protein